MPTASDIFTRPAGRDDAKLVHEVYLQTPRYFEIISIPLPTLAEVERELEAAAQDGRRFVELIFAAGRNGARPSPPEAATAGNVIGYLDYKLDYPQPGDATVNLLLIIEPLQSRGFGRRVVRDLERRLSGRVHRVLASIYGQNPRAERFWRSLGYHFAIDAKPILDWYAKVLAPSASLSDVYAQTR